MGSGPTQLTDSYTVAPLATPRRTCGSDSPEIAIAREMDHTDPVVIAFGDEEYRTATMDGPLPRQSMTRWLADHMIPRLSQKGFKDIVVEFFPDDPTLQAELDAYAANPTAYPSSFPRLSEIVRRMGDPGLPKLLETCRKYGVRVHGGRGSWVQLNQFMMNIESEILGAARVIRDSTLGKVRALRAEGRKVALWNGYLHNDVRPRGRWAEISFGDELHQETSGRYLEVDLFHKRVVTHRTDFTSANSPSAEISLAITPFAKSRTGKSDCLRTGDRSLVILLPDPVR